MERRQLGRTGLQVGVIGLGTEYLEHATRETVVTVVQEALDNGANFLDVLMSQPDYRSHLGAALRGRRHSAVIQGHLGNAFANGQSFTTRDRALCEQSFHDLLDRLGTDYVDVLNIQMVDKPEDYQTDVLGAGGLLEMAQRFISQGKVRHVALSTHNSEIAMQAIQSGQFAAVMVGLNMNWPQPAVAPACAEHGVGLVAMKPYDGGEFFQTPYSNFITPIKALAYVAAQPGVSTIVPGAKDVAQLRQALAYVTASEAEREFMSIVANFKERLIGGCVYCNHCLPCPSSINIGDTMRALRAQDRGAAWAAPAYQKLPAKASACSDCGACLERCPFKVDIPAEMRRAVSVFEQAGR